MWQYLPEKVIDRIDVLAFAIHQELQDINELVALP
jgi:hypothetical protein